jgi:hypothetical protein
MTATTIYDALRESHEIQRAVFRKLLRSGRKEVLPGLRNAIERRTEGEACRPVPSRLSAHAPVAGGGVPVNRLRLGMRMDAA